MSESRPQRDGAASARWSPAAQSRPDSASPAARPVPRSSRRVFPGTMASNQTTTCKSARRALCNVAAAIMSESRRKLWTLVLCCTAQFMVILDVSIVNVALPSIRNDLGFSATNLQWVVNAYTLTFAGFLLLGGRAADLLGQRRVFVAGLLLFGGASLVGGLSTSQGMLIGARALQGFGGAVVAPATLSVISTHFAEGAERNRALGAWGAMGGAGGATGA